MESGIQTLSVSDPSVAAELLWAAHEAGSRLTQGLDRVRDRVSANEFAQIAQAVGGVLGHDLLDFSQSLVQQHPQFRSDDLDAFFDRLEAAGVMIDDRAARLGGSERA